MSIKYFGSICYGTGCSCARRFVLSPRTSRGASGFTFTKKETDTQGMWTWPKSPSWQVAALLKFEPVFFCLTWRQQVAKPGPVSVEKSQVLYSPPLHVASSRRPLQARGNIGEGRTQASGRKSTATVSALFRVLENTRDLSLRNCGIMAVCGNQVHRRDVLHPLDFALPSA